MTDEKQGPYPAGQPPPYQGVSQPFAGFGPPPGEVPPPGPPPQGYPQGQQPPPAAHYQYGAPMGPPQPGPPPTHPGGYMAAQPVVAQPMVPGSSVIVVQQHMFRQSPVNCVCPHCHQNVITSTKAEAGGLTWLLCAGICLFGFWLGCCLIPFCIDDCQDIHHSCPSCKHTIHVFRRL